MKYIRKMNSGHRTFRHLQHLHHLPWLVVSGLVTLTCFTHCAVGADPSCDVTLTADFGRIQSPSYPQPYPPDVDCQWHINVTSSPTSSGVTLTVQYFFTEPTTDQLLLYNTDPSAAGAQPFRSLSGKLQSNTRVTSTSSELWLLFRAGSSQASPESDPRGFDIVYLSNGANIACDDPGAPLHGQVTSSGNFTIGSEVQFQCDVGYRLEGTNKITCQLSQGSTTFGPRWSDAVPQCLSSCPNPTGIDHGSFVRDTSNLEVNATVTYSCDEPYLTQNRTQVKCVLIQGSPAWDSPPPTCSIPDCKTWQYISLTQPSWTFVNPSYPQRGVAGGGRLCHWTIQVEEGKAINFNVSYVDIPRDALFKLTDPKITSTDLLRINGRDETSFQFPLNITSFGSTVTALYVGVGPNATDKRGFYVSYTTVDSSAPPILPTSTIRTTSTMVVTTSHAGPSSEKVPPPSDDEGDDSASTIAIAVTVPLIVLVLAGLGVFYCMYRKKYPVRMILGRDFGKFQNPSYRAPSRPHTLVREDAEEFFQQTQPGGPGGRPNISLIIGGGDTESSASYQNVGFVFDSGEADEEEVERRFRERKGYLFKKTEDSVDGGDVRDSKAPLVKNAQDSEDKADHDEEERGKDNPAYEADADETDGDVIKRSKKEPKGGSQSDDKASDTSDSDKASDSEMYSKPLKKSPSPSEEDSSEKPQKEEVEYHAGMTVKQFLELVRSREKRALSDTPRERAGSFSHYDQSLSARRRSQSVDTALEPEHLTKLTDRFKANVSVLRVSSDAGRYAEQTSHLRHSESEEIADAKKREEEETKERQGEEEEVDHPSEGVQEQQQQQHPDAKVAKAAEARPDREITEAHGDTGADENDSEGDLSDVEYLSDQDSYSGSELGLKAKHAGRTRGEGSLSNLLTEENSGPGPRSESDAAARASPTHTAPENTAVSSPDEAGVGEGALNEGGEAIYDDVFPGDEGREETPPPPLPATQIPDTDSHASDEGSGHDRKDLSSENSDNSTDEDSPDYVNVQALASDKVRDGDDLEPGEEASAADSGHGDPADKAVTPDRQVSTEDESFVVLSKNGHRFDQSDSTSSSGDSLPPHPPEFADLEQNDKGMPAADDLDSQEASGDTALAKGRSDSTGAQGVDSTLGEDADKYSIKTNSSFSSIPSQHMSDADNASLSADETTFSVPLSEAGNQDNGVRSASPRQSPPLSDAGSGSDSDDSGSGFYGNWSPADAERDQEPARKVQIVPRVRFSDTSSESASAKDSDTEPDDESGDEDGKLRLTVTSAHSHEGRQVPPDSEAGRGSPPVSGQQSPPVSGHENPPVSEQDSDAVPAPPPVVFVNPSFSQASRSGSKDTEQETSSRPRGLAALKQISASLSHGDDTDSDNDIEITEADIDAVLEGTDSSEDDQPRSLAIGGSPRITVQPEPLTVSADPSTTYVFSEESEDIDV